MTLSGAGRSRAEVKGKPFWEWRMMWGGVDLLRWSLATQPPTTSCPSSGKAMPRSRCNDDTALDAMDARRPLHLDAHDWKGVNLLHALEQDELSAPQVRDLIRQRAEIANGASPAPDVEDMERS